MSRAQQGDVNATAAAQNSSYNANATDAFKQAEGDVGSYADEVGAFKASNPYGQGGPVATADNQMAADTAAGQAQSAGQAVQSAAVRTGQNAGGAIAATEQMQQQNERNLVGQEAAANKDRAAADTGYKSAVVGDTGNIATMQDQLATQQGGLAQGALGTQEQSAQTPSFLDELGQGVIGAGENFAKVAKFCWVAAELWGWNDPRTDLVRSWLNCEFRHSWYGAAVCWFYSRWGIHLAIAIKTRRRLRRCCQWVFDRALVAATKWQIRETL